MNLDVDFVVRVVAALAAFALVASPGLVAGVKAVQGWLAQKPAVGTGEVGITEMRVVLDLANKLRQAGNAEGVTLCQRLIDVMLKPGVKP